jgi:type IV pilus assembly protein PilM
VKVCELRSRGDELYLEAFDYEDLPPETIVDGELMNATAVSDAVSQILDRNGISRSPTALSVSGNTVIIKKITLPLMTQEELEESIQWEAEQFIPYDIEDVCIGFEVLAPKTEQGQMDVVLVAAKKEMINDYVGVCHQVGLEPMVVDVDSFAVQNMY